MAHGSIATPLSAAPRRAGSALSCPRASALGRCIFAPCPPGHSLLLLTVFVPQLLVVLHLRSPLAAHYISISSY
ncbi:hypothetical protein C8R45DRAFT_1095970 [Mycena sanguinolenta]|nr:hypothetical protein C8R45DRAFT_1095970 [Mycena sanguinolenta]